MRTTKFDLIRFSTRCLVAFSASRVFRFFSEGSFRLSLKNLVFCSSRPNPEKWKTKNWVRNHSPTLVVSSGLTFSNPTESSRHNSKTKWKKFAPRNKSGHESWRAGAQGWSPFAAARPRRKDSRRLQVFHWHWVVALFHFHYWNFSESGIKHKTFFNIPPFLSQDCTSFPLTRLSTMSSGCPVTVMPSTSHTISSSRTSPLRPAAPAGSTLSTASVPIEASHNKLIPTPQFRPVAVGGFELSTGVGFQKRPVCVWVCVWGGESEWYMCACARGGVMDNQEIACDSVLIVVGCMWHCYWSSACLGLCVCAVAFFCLWHVGQPLIISVVWLAVGSAVLLLHRRLLRVILACGLGWEPRQRQSRKQVAPVARQWLCRHRHLRALLAHHCVVPRQGGRVGSARLLLVCHNFSFRFFCSIQKARETALLNILSHALWSRHPKSAGKELTKPKE